MILAWKTKFSLTILKPIITTAKSAKAKGAAKMKIEFDTWKAEYQPRVYESSGEMCDEHDTFEIGAEPCECEFLYTYDQTDPEDEDEETDYPEDSLRLAIKENRVWTWDNQGIRSGITGVGSELLVTKKAWTQQTEVS